ncbi:hypothetical protein [Streptomyces sp. NPDC058424]|uniref:hypothetical protein n=1 Tax=Streptomyces sp. NPDC058424 TaxID=3346491 RepID=UPI0036545371
MRNVVLAGAERFAAVHVAVLVHDQEVAVLEREGDLSCDQLVRQLSGGVGVFLIECGLGEHLGGEPDESAVCGLAVQDRATR